MNSQQAREFRERWEAVAAIETRELREASIFLRWQQMNAIFRLAMGLGLLESEEDDPEVNAVRRRWLQLKGIAT
jgi:hypothetical protein